MIRQISDHENEVQLLGASGGLKTLVLEPDLAYFQVRVYQTS